MTDAKVDYTTRVPPAGPQAMAWARANGLDGERMVWPPQIRMVWPVGPTGLTGEDPYEIIQYGWVEDGDGLIDREAGEFVYETRIAKMVVAPEDVAD